MDAAVAHMDATLADMVAISALMNASLARMNASFTLVRVLDAHGCVLGAHGRILGAIRGTLLHPTADTQLHTTYGSDPATLSVYSRRWLSCLLQRGEH